jgi:hypothetical protein
VYHCCFLPGLLICLDVAGVVKSHSHRRLRLTPLAPDRILRLLPEFELYRLCHPSSESVHAIEIFATFVVRGTTMSTPWVWNWMRPLTRLRFDLSDAHEARD